MIKLIDFIESNFSEFKSLVDSEVLELDSSSVDSEIVEYLKLNFRFDYKSICVYFSDNLVCIENCV